MKTFLFACSFALMLLGCSMQVAQPINEPLTASTGSTMVKWSQPLVGENRILYGGRDGNTLLVSYREFRSSQGGLLAAPAFTQELRYNLDNSNIITFRDIKLKIIAATNESISYEILNPPASMYSDS
jgi:hypothetical protein